MEIILILLLAVAIDLALGEPPRLIHPVVWMGKAISFLERGAIDKSAVTQLFYGLAMTLVATGLFAVPAYFALMYLKSLGIAAYIIGAAMLLKTTFSLKELRKAALRVKNLLLKDRLDEARFELRSLVSRDSRGLSKPLMASATVESVAESTCDSFVAPLFYFLLLGVPGAVGYRVVNTLDAMIGYHGRYEYLGKFASRLDDVLNFIPARLTALLLVLATFLSRRDARASWHAALSEHSKTESPNAGWTMSAIAGALGVQLEKVGHYKLGDNHHSLSLSTIDASVQIITTTALVWSLLLILAEVIYHVTT